MALVVTEQEFNEWQDNRVTRAFKKALFNDREYLKEVLLAGTDDDSNLRGRAQAIALILSLDYQGFMEALREHKYE